VGHWAAFFRGKSNGLRRAGDPSRSTTHRNCNWLARQTRLSAFTEPKALFPALANRLGTGYRDRPLTFQWQSPPGFIEVLGLPAARNGACEPIRLKDDGDDLVDSSRGARRRSLLTGFGLGL
jgi:hypothetical protein